MANQNGRNVAMPDENRPSWRPEDEQQRNRRSMSDDDDRYMQRDRDDRYMRDRDEDRFWEDRNERSSRWDRDEGYRSTERYGQGQSGYGAGRYDEDRSYQSRNLGYPSHMEERPRERGLDERFSQGRGGSRWGGEHQEGGMYGHGPGSWGNEGYIRQGMDYGSGMGRGYSGYNEGAQRSSTQQRYGSQGYQGFRQQQPSHRGKGPAGYQRSDERIREIVCEALSDDHNVDATNIDVTVKNGEVVLSGTVDDRMQKRMAEDCVFQISGVKDVQNQIRVATERKAGSKESESSSMSTSDKKARA